MDLTCTGVYQNGKLMISPCGGYKKPTFKLSASLQWRKDVRLVWFIQIYIPILQGGAPPVINGL